MKQNSKDSNKLLVFALIFTLMVMAAVIYFHLQENNNELSKESKPVKNINSNNFSVGIECSISQPITDSLSEAHQCVAILKKQLEGPLSKSFFYKNERIKGEKFLQDLFTLTLNGLKCYPAREPNTGSGNPDFVFSNGSGDLTVVEFKLAKSMSALKHGLTKQIAKYKSDVNTTKSIFVIAYFNATEKKNTEKVLKDLQLEQDPNIVTIDARRNKASASKMSKILA